MAAYRGLPDRFPTKQGLKLSKNKKKAIALTTPRPISNKTRIETSLLVNVAIIDKLLPDRFPTKQGLKHHNPVFVEFLQKTPRPISNKTRIET